MSILCRMGFHRRLGRSVRSISAGYHGFCRDCGVGMTKPWGKRWRIATVEETLERQLDAERSAALRAAAAAENLPRGGTDEPARRRVTRVKRDLPAPKSGDKSMFPKSHRRKLEEADIHRRAIDLAFYLIRDHGDGAEAALAERLHQPGLTSSDRRRLKYTEIELAERRKRDRAAAKGTPGPAGA